MADPDLLEHGESIVLELVEEWISQKFHNSVDEAAVRQFMAKLTRPPAECDQCRKLKGALKNAAHAMDNAHMMAKEAVRAYDKHLLSLPR